MDYHRNFRFGTAMETKSFRCHQDSARLGSAKTAHLLRSKTGGKTYLECSFTPKSLTRLWEKRFWRTSCIKFACAGRIGPWGRSSSELAGKSANELARTKSCWAYPGGWISPARLCPGQLVRGFPGKFAR